MTIIWKMTAIIAALMLAAAPARAASFENAGRLVEALGLENQLQAAILDAMAQAKTQLYAAGAPAQQVDRAVAALQLEMQESAPALIAGVTQIYADKFSDSEVNDLVDFYETPTGQRFAESQSEILEETLGVTQTWLQGVAQRAEQRMTEISPTV